MNTTKHRWNKKRSFGVRKKYIFQTFYCIFRVWRTINKRATMCIGGHFVLNVIRKNTEGHGWGRLYLFALIKMCFLLLSVFFQVQVVAACRSSGGNGGSFDNLSLVSFGFCCIGSVQTPCSFSMLCSTRVLLLSSIISEWILLLTVSESGSVPFFCECKCFCSF